MLETWSPNKPLSNKIDVTLLQTLASLSLSSPSIPADLLNSQQINQIAGWLKSPQNDWQQAVLEFSEQDLRQLALFFTVTEDHEAKWQSGDKNPAIYILRLMKEQGSYPEKDFIRALKKQTTNRFIPYGSAL